MCSLIDVVLLNRGKERLHASNIYNCPLHNCSPGRIAQGYFITVYIVQRVHYAEEETLANSTNYHVIK